MIQLSKEQILLDNNMKANIEWYYNLIRSKNKKKIETQEELNTFQNLIAKLGIWYELIYPDRMIKEAIIKDNGSSIERYNLGLEKEETIINYDDNYYNKDKFINSLSIKEQILLKPFPYPSIIDISIANGRVLLLLNHDGYVLNSLNLEETTFFKDASLKELWMSEHIKDVINFFKDNNWPITGDLHTLMLCIRFGVIKQYQNIKIYGMIYMLKVNLIERVFLTSQSKILNSSSTNAI